jgi:hypothetical protein
MNENNEKLPAGLEAGATKIALKLAATASIGRVVPVLTIPSQRQVADGAPKRWRVNQDQEIAGIIIGAYKRTHRMVRAFRRRLYAKSDEQSMTLAGAQKRNAELSGMLELIGLLDKNDFQHINGHVTEHIELERQYVEQVIKSLSGGE